MGVLRTLSFLTVAFVSLGSVLGVHHPPVDHEDTFTEEMMDPHMNFVLIGATGNLAEKYLWQALFNIHLDGLDHAADLMVWPAATKNERVGYPALQAILHNNVTNPSDVTLLARFRNQVVMMYHQLRDPDQYADLGNKLDEAHPADELARYVYLSVPPKFYGKICDKINSDLRPHKYEQAFLRVIVEKPFGTSLASAEALAERVFQSLEPEEVLLVDHYMGKVGVQAIRDFREQNPSYEELFTGEKLSSVEISMVETEDCDGRTGFYNDVGVVRDTMQNHLTEMLALFTMPLGTDPDPTVDHTLTEAERRRLILDECFASSNLHTIDALGQYSSYRAHVDKDRDSWGEPPVEDRPKVPTYAKITLRVDPHNEDPHCARWKGVDFVMTSGKNLPQRRAFLRANFKEGDASVTFMVQGELPNAQGTVAKGAQIVVSSTLPRPVLPADEWSTDKSGRILTPDAGPNAYEVLLWEVLHMREGNYVRLPEVLASWRIWDTLVSASESGSGELQGVSIPEMTEYAPGGAGLEAVDPLNAPEVVEEDEL